MNSKTKVWLIIATFLTLIGLVIFVAVMTVNNWDFTKLSTAKYQTNEYILVDEFSDIEINVNTTDITIYLSQDGNNKVICFENENELHNVTVVNGKLNINYTNQKRLSDYLSINVNSPNIAVYLNQTTYQSLTVKGSTCDVNIGEDFTFKDIDVSLSTGDVKCSASAQESIKIQTSTGDIKLNDLSASDITLNVSSGNITLDGVNCKSLISNGNTGNITLKNVIAIDKFEIERSTGDVNFENCDAGEICVETDTGNVKGTLLSSKIFITSTDTGRIDVPNTTIGGKCKIETDTGNIIITIV